MKNRLLELYGLAIDSEIKEYAEQYNKLLRVAIKDCLNKKDDSLFRDIGIETQYMTQYDTMMQIREELFGYNRIEQNTLNYAM